MGMFDAYGIDADAVEAVEAGGGGPQPGTYPAVISGARLNQHDDYGMALILEYKIEGYEYLVQEWFNLPNRPGPWDDTTKDDRGYTEDQTNRRNLGLLKQRLLSVGVPETKVNEVDPVRGDLNGTEVVLTLVKNKKGYTAVAKRDGVRVKPATANSLPEPTSPVAGFNPSWS